MFLNTSFHCQLLFFALIAMSTPGLSGQDGPQTNCHQFGHGMTCNSHLNLDSSSSKSLSINWNIAVGEGRSQVIGIDDQVYVTSGTSEEKDGEVMVTTTTQRIDASTGIHSWSYQTSSTMHASQETFRNANATPQATPAIAGFSLITVSFTGQLTCLNRADGKLLWEKDLVKDFGSGAMQYGFASSPVVDFQHDERVYVLAGGDSGGLLCLNVADGSVIWKSKCDSSSYATPVFAQFGNVRQLVIESEDEVIGVAESDGSQMWNYTLPQQGLTNAATPLVVDQSHLVISGNGCSGTRCISIAENHGEWQVDEKWFVPNVKFVYTNWTMLTDGVVVGCTDKFLAAIDVTDGSILGRWRGYFHGNVTRAGQSLLAVDANGKLSVFDAEDATLVGFTITGEYKIFAARCWVPISIVGNRLFVRGDDRLACLDLNVQGEPLKNQLRSPKMLTVEHRQTKPNNVPAE